MNDEQLELAMSGISLEAISEDEERTLINLLANRIAELLEGNPDLLFSTLYRLDIYESKINTVLKIESDAPVGLARLIIERQREKLRTRKKYKSDSEVDWADDL